MKYLSIEQLQIAFSLLQRKTIEEKYIDMTNAIVKAQATRILFLVLEIANESTGSTFYYCFHFAKVPKQNAKLQKL